LYVVDSFDEPCRARTCDPLIKSYRPQVFTPVNFQVGIAWLRENGVKVIDVASQECADLLGGYIAEHHEVWNEDIGED